MLEKERLIGFAVSPPRAGGEWRGDTVVANLFKGTQHDLKDVMYAI